VSGRVEIWLFIIQRLAAAVLAPLVLVHFATIVYAFQDGLSAAEILSRTQSSAALAVFYGLFVVAAALHGTIGLRAILREHTAWRWANVNTAATAFLVMVLWLGLGAVAAVT
jgi:fumarate reductase subunit C